MEPTELSRRRLVLALVAGATAGALSMAIVMVVPQEVGMQRLAIQGLVDAVFLTLWFLVFTVPIALVVGVPGYYFLRKRCWLSPASACITGALAWLGHSSGDVRHIRSDGSAGVPAPRRVRRTGCRLCMQRVHV